MRIVWRCWHFVVVVIIVVAVDTCEHAVVGRDPNHRVELVNVAAYRLLDQDVLPGSAGLQHPLHVQCCRQRSVDELQVRTWRLRVKGTPVAPERPSRDAVC